MAKRKSRMLYVQYQALGGLPPVLNSASLFLAEGWTVSMLGAEMHGGLPMPPDLSRRIRTICVRANYRGLRQKFAYALFNIRFLIEVAAFRPDCIYASDPMSCLATLLVCCFFRKRVIYHEHDVPGELKAWKRLCARARFLLARRACLCIAPSEGRAQILSNESGGARVAVVWNCPGLREVRPARSRQKQGKIRLYYHGHISQLRLPLEVLDALALTPDLVTLRAVGFETVATFGYVDQLRARAIALHLTHRVEVCGPVPRGEVLDQCALADVGFACMPLIAPDPNFSTMVGASVKSLDYMACGLPLLVSDLPEWRSTFVDTGYGIACNPHDPSSIAAALCWFANHTDEMYEMGERGRQRILNDWNYEKQFQQILNAATA